MITRVGNGKSALFWEDRWIQGMRVQDLTPGLYMRVRKKVRAACTVFEAMLNGAWALDIGPDIDITLLSEVFELWERVMEVELLPAVEDSTAWAWEASGIYSARSAYAARFWGMESAPFAEMAWSSKAPRQCRFFAWLAGRNRCWTSDRLARRGLPHQAACPFCDQEPETLNHVLIRCVLARVVWHQVLSALGTPELTPEAGDAVVEWCNACAQRAPSKKEAKDIRPWRL
ncbi:uncharacterized protein [Aegilops tauschii subsp. strangulata]|uniref:uncharacterized protein n=1 Tax=Aegilops tauschii subsp. strangulata TaxID=200361 RepID=UPI003CC89330